LAVQADKQGELKLNDKVIAVAQGDYEWISTKKLRLQKIVDMIRGERGSTVNLKVIPADDPTITKEISIVRGEVALKNKLATAELLESPSAMGKKMKVGWITLPSFYADMEEGKVGASDRCGAPAAPPDEGRYRRSRAGDAWQWRWFSGRGYPHDRPVHPLRSRGSDQGLEG